MTCLYKSRTRRPLSGPDYRMADVYNCSRLLILKSASLPRRRCAKPEAHFSNCWWRLRTTNRLTCTGMGTTIFPAPPPLTTPFGHFDRPRIAFPPALLFWPSLPHAFPDNKLALTRFHFARRFWNHIFTCGCDTQEKKNNYEKAMIL